MEDPSEATWLFLLLQSFTLAELLSYLQGSIHPIEGYRIHRILSKNVEGGSQVVCPVDQQILRLNLSPLNRLSAR